MDPTVAAAAIGVGGTVVVGVAGFAAAIWGTKRTIAHDRANGVWDRRADVYIEALAALNHRQIRRGLETQTGPVHHQVRQGAQEYLATYQQPDWSALEARLLAFASEPVFSAVQASSTAHRKAIDAFKSWRELAARQSPSGEGIEVANTAAETARQSAENADDVVVELIRAELQGRGRPLGDWQAFPEPGTATPTARTPQPARASASSESSGTPTPYTSASSSLPSG